MAGNRRVLISQKFFDQASLDYLRDHGCEAEVLALPPGRADGDLAEDELRDCLAGAAGWIVGHARVTRSLLAALPGLAVVSRRGVGYERVDLAAARELGRVVTIAAGGNDAAVADHTIGLMLAVGRRFRRSQADMAAGKWAIQISTDLYRKTVGIIGYGRIGRSVIKRLSGFDATVLVCTPGPVPPDAPKGVEFVSLPELLRRSDYVSVHAPLTPATRFMIDAAALAAMRPGAILVNAARGGLVDDRALLAALEAGHLAGAGLDVFVSESDPDYREVTAALLARDDVVATPHAAASSREGLDRTNMIAARSVVAVLDGGDPPADCVVADGRSRSQAG
ncbi:D-3-phosphoglycerate dehydrogenase [Nitrospirillum amazonense]|uniref:D-3-phosphoglycerate dehydrogenase n=1 Tax=Nitrospirillum amazonense TaxID=28077 RepID=A0A560FFH5_9PROT|nr:phosphoglycerate dehydrogenase [Nitrospirillum amazonense]TWB20348.1 D-3-phosphoglycerate dehydrogenase [Nitrospirillum amazonense]